VSQSYSGVGGPGAFLPERERGDEGERGIEGKEREGERKRSFWIVKEIVAVRLGCSVHTYSISTFFMNTSEMFFFLKDRYLHIKGESIFEMMHT
jgi:hypothetical protein